METDDTIFIFKNPMSKMWVTLFSIFTAVSSFFAINAYMTEHYLEMKIFGVGLWGSLCCLFIVLFSYTQVIVKPSWVTIRKDGAILKYRTGKERFVPWSEWDCINRADTDTTTRKGKIDRAGRGKLKGHIVAFDLTYEIAEAMQKAYVGELKYQKVGPWIVLDTTDYSKRSTRR